jgi:alkanesulfonate monooxygenase SsuD/methylene tetrahydromethanopterin reductase-like flavin-dependent oxidoreductase (luciferase family)
MAPRLRFGCGFDLRNPPEWPRDWAGLYAEHLDFIAWTESLGFENVWLAEHHGIEDGYMPSPLVFGAAIAARTKTMRIGTGVALAPFYHPVRLAEDCAVLDQISNGRFELTLGIGYLDFEAEAYGFDLKTRGRRSDELLQIVRRLWRGETVTFAGEFFDIRGARCFPQPIQKPAIPLFIGGVTAPGFRRAARYGEGFNGPVEYWPDYLAAVRAEGKDESAARIQSMSASDMWFFVTDDPQATREEVAPHAFYQLNKYAEWQKDAGWGGVKRLDYEEFKNSDQIKVFTPAEAIAYLKGRQALAPIEAFCMQAPAGFPLSKYAKYVETFAKQVLPAFR